VPSPTLFEPVGCRACAGTGYRGRLALGEVMLMSEGVQRLVLARATSAAIERQAIAEGMVPLARDGLRHAMRGETSIAEVFRVSA